MMDGGVSAEVLQLKTIYRRAGRGSLSVSLTLALPLYDLPLRLHLANSRATPSASQKRASQRRAASTSESLQAFASPLLRLNKSLCVNETCYLQPPCSLPEIETLGSLTETQRAIIKAVRVCA